MLPCLHGLIAAVQQPVLKLVRGPHFLPDIQVISNMVDFGMDPQTALDAPRFQIAGVDSCYGPGCVEESR